MSPVRVPVNQGMQGSLVAELHAELTRLRFDTVPAERQERFFGDSTRRAVVRFQEGYGLEVTGSSTGRPPTSSPNAWARVDRARPPLVRAPSWATC